jgi:hypothetical protein
MTGYPLSADEKVPVERVIKESGHRAMKPGQAHASQRIAD